MTTVESGGCRSGSRTQGEDVESSCFPVEIQVASVRLKIDRIVNKEKSSLKSGTTTRIKTSRRQVITL